MSTHLMHPEKRALEWIDRQRDRLISTVQDWSHINSGSFNRDGLKRMASEIENAFGVLGASLERRNIDPFERINAQGEIETIALEPVLHFVKRPEANRKILLTGHMDTVFPKDHHFQRSVFTDANTLNGPGVADMKGGLLVMLTALEAFEQSEYADQLGYEILISPDEEIGSIGSAPILAERAKAADFGMTYEPALADGTLAGQRKGSGNFTLIAHGKSAHAGREFHDGRNAITFLSKVIVALDALNGVRDEVTINIAVINAGTVTNVVPDLAICRLNVRVGNRDDCDWFIDNLNRIVTDANKVEGFTLKSHGGFNRPPKIIDDKHKRLFEFLSECGKSLDIGIEFKPTGGCCEGNNLAAAGLPNIDTLGVRGGLIHSDKEFVCVDSFTERAKLSALLLMRYASGAFQV